MLVPPVNIQASVLLAALARPLLNLFSSSGGHWKSCAPPVTVGDTVVKVKLQIRHDILILSTLDRYKKRGSSRSQIFLLTVLLS